MTKVEHTMLYLANSLDSIHKLVTDAELVLVECKPEESLLFEHHEGAMFLSEGKYCGMGKHLKPILISRTEKIEVGDWVYDKITNETFQVKGWEKHASENYKKIIALPEHFSPQQLKDIVDGKLKEGKVVVECEENPQYSLSQKGYLHLKCIKLNSSNHITLYPVKEKMYTREEMEIMFGLGAANHATGIPSFEDALSGLNKL